MTKTELGVLHRFSLRSTRQLLFLAALLCHAATGVAADQQWVRVSSDHFTVLTDAGEKRGHEVAARFEQMRALFGQLLMRNKLRMSEPLEIIALRSDKDYAQLAPIRDGQPLASPAFFLAGQDRCYVVLDVFEPDSWRAVEHQLAHYLLNYNYPPTQSWFDEGFAEYFASLELKSKQVELGADPELRPAYVTDLVGNSNPTNGLNSLTEILSNPVWLAWPDLLTMKNRVANGQEGTHNTLFYAQSWILVHYLLNRHKLEQTGAYFDLVENQKLGAEQAFQQAFNMSFAQLDHEVKDYFRSLKPLFAALDQSKLPDPAPPPEPVYEIALPFLVEDVAASAKSVPLAEAQALVDEMELRLPEHQQQVFEHLAKLASDPKTETVVAHRALAWSYVERTNTAKAFEELASAVEMNPSDPWTRFGLALASYNSGAKGARVQGLANMMESLHLVINEYPDFAEAYRMLGWARLAGGGANAALEALKMAVALSPRNEQYQLELAEACLAAHKFDDASSILGRLKLSQDSGIQRAAKKDLNDLPFLKKYGIPPKEEPQGNENAAAVSPRPPGGDSEDEEEAPKPAAPQPEPERRPVRFLKARLLSVDCSHPPAAILALSEGKRILKLGTPNYKSVIVIGEPEFSCSWKNISANINYRPGGKLDGDLVSIELP